MSLPLLPVPLSLAASGCRIYNEQGSGTMPGTS
jgi:hypothetical protein